MKENCLFELLMVEVVALHHNLVKIETICELGWQRQEKEGRTTKTGEGANRLHWGCRLLDVVAIVAVMLSVGAAAILQWEHGVSVMDLPSAAS